VCIFDEETVMDLYEQIDEWLFDLGSDCIPAEIHGLYCGISASYETDKLLEEFIRTFIEYISIDVFDFQIDHPVFLLFLEYSGENLDNFDFKLTMLLPDDDNPIFERIEALSRWSFGFLNGVKNDLGDNFQTINNSDLLMALDEIEAISEINVDYHYTTIEYDFIIVLEHLKLSAISAIYELKRIRKNLQ